MSMSPIARGRLTPGTLIFAKMKSYPPWPAKIVSAEDFPGPVSSNRVPVKFLGTNEYGHVLPKDCFPYSEYRHQFGTPKKIPFHAESLIEADSLAGSSGTNLSSPVSVKSPGSTAAVPTTKAKQSSEKRDKPESSPSTLSSASAEKASSAVDSPMPRKRGRPKATKPEAESSKKSDDEVSSDRRAVYTPQQKLESEPAESTSLSTDLRRKSVSGARDAGNSPKRRRIDSSPTDRNESADLCSVSRYADGSSDFTMAGLSPFVLNQPVGMDVSNQQTAKDAVSQALLEGSLSMESESHKQEPTVKQILIGEEDDHLGLVHAEKLLPASQLAEIAATAVFEPTDRIPVDNVHMLDNEAGSAATTESNEEDEEYLDDAITNDVVRQLDELEKQDAIGGQDADIYERHLLIAEGPSRRSYQSSGMPNVQYRSTPRRRGRPKKPSNVGAGPGRVSSPRKSVPELASGPMEALAGTSHESIESDDLMNRGVPFGDDSASSNNEANLGNDNSALGKRRHKPKSMSDYFLEYDYTSPRAHRKSESGTAGPPLSVGIASPQQKVDTGKPQKIVSTGNNVEGGSKINRGRKTGGLKSTKDLEKAALEAEIECVKMAAEESVSFGQQPQAPIWQRHDAPADLTFDDSMFEVTVNVEETTNTSGHGHTVSGLTKKQQEIVDRLKERERQRPKLKVKLLKTPMHAPASEMEPGKKSKAPVARGKKPAKIQVQMAKKFRAKAAAATSDLSTKKKPGRKPLLAHKAKHEKRVTGYSLWAEREMEKLRLANPNVKGLTEVRNLLQTTYRQLSDTEKQSWRIMAKREKEKRVRAFEHTKSSTKDTKSKQQQQQQLQPLPQLPQQSSVGSPNATPAEIFGVATDMHLPAGPAVFEPLNEQLFTQSVGSPATYFANINETSDVTPVSEFGTSRPQAQPPAIIDVAAVPPVKRKRGRPPKDPEARMQKMAATSTVVTKIGSPSMEPTSPMMSYSDTSRKPQGKPLRILTAGERRPTFQQQKMVEQIAPELEQVQEVETKEVEQLHQYENEAMVHPPTLEPVENRMQMDETDVGHHHSDYMHQSQHMTDDSADYLSGDNVSMREHYLQPVDETKDRKRETKKRPRGRPRTKKSPTPKPTPVVQQPQQQSSPQRYQLQMPAQSYDEEEEDEEPEEMVNYQTAFLERTSEEERVAAAYYYSGTQDVGMTSDQEVQALLEPRSPPGILESRARWWLHDSDDQTVGGNRKSDRALSPPRALTAEPLDAAAVFRLIGRTFESLGNRLLREGDDGPTAVASAMDMLMDGLVSSLSHLLTLTGAVPPFDRRYHRQEMSRLIEDTAMIIPL